MDKRRDRAIRICDKLRKAGYRALLAGGCVRDMILEVEPRDYDIATSARPDEVARLFPKCIGVGAEFGVQIVALREGAFEVATFRKDGPYSDGRHPDGVEFVDEIEDAKRRDFTINALFYDPESDEVIDYIGGRDDIARRCLRTVGDPRRRFSEDYLRLLRAVRFAARLDYEIAPETFDALREMAPNIVKTSAERIRDELLKILTEGGARRAFALLDASGLLATLLPEIAAMKGVEQPPEFHPEGDVFEHTMLMLDLLEGPSRTLAMGVLLHDVGKPPTQTFEDRIRFNNHCKVGARMSEKICRRLRFSNDDTERIAWMVGHHMRVDSIPEMRESKRKRFVREPGFAELLELCRLDCLASHNALGTIEWIQEYCASLKPDQLKPPPLLRGGDLTAMGYRPGPVYSAILRSLEDEQLDGTIASADHAKAWVRQRWPLEQRGLDRGDEEASKSATGTKQ